MGAQRALNPPERGLIPPTPTKKISRYERETHMLEASHNN